MASAKHRGPQARQRSFRHEPHPDRQHYRRGPGSVVRRHRAGAAAEQAGLAAEAQAEATGQRVAALANLQRERDEMRSELETEARQLAPTIAARLLGRVPADAVTAALLQPLESRLAAVTEEERRTLAGAILPTSL